MTITEIASFVAGIFGCWSLGFSFGWTITTFRDAASKV